ncbi:unnamed protein product [Closterium sp. NIES-64]|nr:unnamed protein product [Closterium sp. NIES-64]
MKPKARLLGRSGSKKRLVVPPSPSPSPAVAADGGMDEGKAEERRKEAEREEGRERERGLLGVRRNKGAGARSWLRIDQSGQTQVIDADKYSIIRRFILFPFFYAAPVIEADKYAIMRRCSIPAAPCDRGGQVIEADKYAIMRRCAIPARDLRILDPLLSYPSTLLGREQAIVVNLEHIKCIIMAEEVLLLNWRNFQVARVVEELKARLPLHLNAAGQQNFQVARVEEELKSRLPLHFNATGQQVARVVEWSGGSQGAPAAAPPHSRPPGSKATMCAAAAVAAVAGAPPVAEGGSAAEGAATAALEAGGMAWRGPNALPFEFRALEVCLESACGTLDAESACGTLDAEVSLRDGVRAEVWVERNGCAAAVTRAQRVAFESRALEVCLDWSLPVGPSTLRPLVTTRVEQEAYPALDELTASVSTLNLERVRQIKSRLVVISGRVQKVRDELEQLLDDDEDRDEMYVPHSQTSCYCVAPASSYPLYQQLGVELEHLLDNNEDRDEMYVPHSQTSCYCVAPASSYPLYQQLGVELEHLLDNNEDRDEMPSQTSCCTVFPYFLRTLYWQMRDELEQLLDDDEDMDEMCLTGKLLQHLPCFTLSPTPSHPLYWQVRDELEQLLDDDEDMDEMYLTDKLLQQRQAAAEQQQEEEEMREEEERQRLLLLQQHQHVHGRAEDKFSFGVPSHSGSSARGEKRGGGVSEREKKCPSSGSASPPGLDDIPPDGDGSEGAGSEGAGSEDAGSEGVGSEGVGSEGAGSESTGSDGAGSDGHEPHSLPSVAEHGPGVGSVGSLPGVIGGEVMGLVEWDVEELKMLLEAYFVQIEGTLNKLSSLREYVEDTEDYINIMLDEKQNSLLQMNVLLTTATLFISSLPTQHPSLPLCTRLCPSIPLCAPVYGSIPLSTALHRPQLREYVEDTEDYINIMLDEKQNSLLQMNVLLTTATLFISFFIVVTGVFGMNIDCSYFDPENPANYSVFYYVVIGSTVACIASFILAVVYMRSRGLIVPST